MLSILAFLIGFRLAVPVVYADEASSCSAIKWHYVEHIPAQGFLGIPHRTPDENDDLVSGAFVQISEDIGRLQKWAAMSPDPSFRDKIYIPNYRLTEFCDTLLKHKIRSLWVVCSSDTHINLDPESNKFGSNPDDVTGYVESGCYFSNLDSDRATLGELKDHSMGWDGMTVKYDVHSNEHNPMEHFSDRHEALADPNLRRELYEQVLQKLVNYFADGREPLTHIEKP